MRLDINVTRKNSDLTVKFESNEKRERMNERVRMNEIRSFLQSF